MSVDGNELAARGVLMNGRTLLPLRALAERLGGTLVWDVGGRSAWAAFPQQGKTIHLRVGSRRAAYSEASPVGDQAGTTAALSSDSRSGVLLEITVNEDSGFLVGNGTMYLDISGGTTSSDTNINIPINGGKPF